MSNNSERQYYTDLMTDGYPLLGETLYLQLDHCLIAVQTNHQELLGRLRHYFRHLVISDPERPTQIQVVAIQREPLKPEVTFNDWKRETGKQGRKDAVYDFPGGRLVYKVRTGMLFLQQADIRYAAGDCLANDNQVINFINAQYMNWLQQRGSLICHAAGVVYQGLALGIAAFSGGGKSTSMLRLMDIPGSHFLTNDRLFIRKLPGDNAEIETGAEVQVKSSVEACGVPKLPRINPGTIVTNPVLQNLLSPQRRQELLAMPPQSLWELEEKYDVDVLETYGEARIEHRATLGAFVILNWTRTDNLQANPLNIAQVDLAERRDLLPALMKSPGPFYQKSDGAFFSDGTPLDEGSYIDTLAQVPVFEVTGGLDFDGLVRWFHYGNPLWQD